MEQISNPQVDDSGACMGNDKEFPPKSKTDKTTIITKEPYRRPKKTKINPMLNHFNSLFSKNCWSKFLILKSEKVITPPRLEYNLLRRCPTKEVSFRSLNDNEWLIETTTIKQSESLMSMTDIEGIKVEVSRHANLNSIKGTVVLPRYSGDEEQVNQRMVLESLQMRYDNVEDVEIYSLPSRKHPKSA